MTPRTTTDASRCPLDAGAPSVDWAGEMVDAYGMQREICARAGLDPDGSLREAPLDPVGGAFRLAGPVALSHLCRAVDLVTSSIDILQGRLRASANGYTLVKEPGRPGVPLITVDLRRCPPDRQRRKLAHLCREATGLLGDMQEGPPGIVVVAVLDDQDHVLLAEFDHGLIDQFALHSMFRLMGRAYEHLASGDEPAAARAVASHAGFFAFARRAQLDVAGRRGAEQFWRPVVQSSVCELPMPGRIWRPWRERRSTKNLFWVVPNASVETMARARVSTGTSQMMLFLSALSVVVSGATGAEFVPVTYHRHGRQSGDLPIGPLWDTLITFPPPDASDRLAQWVTDFAGANAQTPSMRGLALVDFASLDQVMELRRFTVNVRLPDRAIRFGRLRATPYDFHDVPRRPSASVAKVKNNIGIRLYQVGPDRIGASVHYDPDDLDDGERILEAVCNTVRQVVEYPAMSVDEARAEALRFLTTDIPGRR